jgi:hypothetical protein
MDDPINWQRIQRRRLKYLSTNVVDETDIAAAEQILLQGDPAVPLFGHDKVDISFTMFS